MGSLSVLDPITSACCLLNHFVNPSVSVVMINIAEAYWELCHYAEVELLAAKTKDILEATGLTTCYVLAVCKRSIF